MFLVKREKSRDFDVVFWSVFGCFLVFGRDKNVERGWAEGKFQICLSGRENQGGGHCKAVSSLSMVAGLKPPLIKLILTPLARS